MERERESFIEGEAAILDREREFYRGRRLPFWIGRESFIEEGGCRFGEKERVLQKEEAFVLDRKREFYRWRRLSFWREREFYRERRLSFWIERESFESMRGVV